MRTGVGVTRLGESHIALARCVIARLGWGARARLRQSLMPARQALREAKGMSGSGTPEINSSGWDG